MTEHKDRSGVDNVTEAEAMEKMKGKAPEDFLLLDVRYDNEYEAKRLPGSRLIPVDELEDRIDEIESETDKLTIVCCNNGNRSYDASLILLEEGFSEVYNLGDGVERWEGIKAFGAQTAIIRQFHSLDEPDEILALAWTMEECMFRFYENMEKLSENKSDREAKNKYAAFKAKANEFLNAIVQQTGNRDSLEEAGVNEDFRLAGGKQSMDELLNWANGRNTREVLEHALHLESSSYDIYRRVEIECDEDSEVRDTYKQLTIRKKQQIEELTELL